MEQPDKASPAIENIAAFKILVFKVITPQELSRLIYLKDTPYQSDIRVKREVSRCDEIIPRPGDGHV